MGVHYTPTKLARFVAERLLRYVEHPVSRPLRVLDPACGDGALLEGLLEEFRMIPSVKVEVHGIETDEDACARARIRLAAFRNADVQIRCGDFLDLTVLEEPQRNLWEPGEPDAPFRRAFDVVIANPPYVRTQVLGAAAAQRLAARFELRGRVDLYQAFWVAATESLRHGGVIGIITSNRFLSTLAGSSIRRFLARQYHVEEVIDLGDTKLFEAAVLPAVFIGRRRMCDRAERPGPSANFMKVYSCSDSAGCLSEQASPPASLYDVLRNGQSGRFSVAEGYFEVTRGKVDVGARIGKIWALNSPDELEWLDSVRAAASGVFADLAMVRVGVKTTADSVFIRSNWDTLPVETRPEKELLRPLLGHEDARRWLDAAGETPTATILYPHALVNGRRAPVDLDLYPQARAYLESHRERLEAREYVLQAGRRWYEIWVPQDPAAWSEPKIVFPDISPEPRFYVDFRGRIVDGDSYWITVLPNVPPDTLYLLLGLANSRLIARYHDLAFNNRLYSDRRRYITQYVSQYPLPSLSRRPVKQLTMLVREYVTSQKARDGFSSVEAFEEEVNGLVNEAFGLGASNRARPAARVPRFGHGACNRCGDQLNLLGLSDGDDQISARNLEAMA